MKKSCAVASCLALLVGGCVTRDTVRFQPNAQQQAMVRDGRQAIVSKKKNSIVLVSPASREIRRGARPVFVVGITNLSKTPTDFLVSNISVTQKRGADAVVSLPVITYEQLVSEERSRQVAAAIIVGLAAGANSYAAARSGYGSAQSTVYSGGRVATVTTNYYSPAAAAVAHANASAQNDAMIANTVEAGRANLANLERGIMKYNTLLPGEWYGGQLHFTSPEENGGEAKVYTITIEIGSEVHQIDVTQEAIKGA